MIKMVKHFLRMIDHHKKIAMDLSESRRLALAHERAQAYSANMARFHRSEIKRLEALMAIANEERAQEHEATQSNVKFFRRNA